MVRQSFDKLRTGLTTNGRIKGTVRQRRMPLRNDDDEIATPASGGLAMT
jgi:hypothetical protein